ncbi:MAG: HAMP domain-containing histidine kinase [Bacteroides sp.]|nr:HAMP domain-containing histidine kinase [Bacteroides sp.]
MKKSIIWLLAVIMGITFAGLLYLQVLYMKNVVRLRDEYFTQGVKRALYEVSSSLEKAETRRFLVEDALQMDAFDPSIGAVLSMPMSQTGFLPNGSKPLPQLSPVNISPSSTLMPAASLRDRIRSQYVYQRALLDEVVINIISQSGNLPIQERADSAEVSDLLKAQLAANGINLPFEFAIVNRMGVIVYKTADYDLRQADNSNTFVQALFANDNRSRTNFIKVYFPDQRDYLYHSIKFLVPSFFLTILLLILSIYTIAVALRQKKLTEMKNDFINNMTHEFKTPISSISLAAQMLNDKSVMKSPQMLEHISTVINDETKRLRFQVEKVLQMSMFDRHNTSLRLQEVDTNTVIANIVNTFKLKVERYGGHLTMHLDAENPLIEVDEMHFTNVIFNLLDNAVKYRNEDRDLNLEISTRNIPNDKIEITVSDNGIGIKKEDLKRIFERFYRVSTGNRHDVKGFGLGLAYVEKMVHEFNGTITVESEFNKGTKFIIILPLTKN